MLTHAVHNGRAQGSNLRLFLGVLGTEGIKTDTLNANPVDDRKSHIKKETFRCFNNNKVSKQSAQVHCNKQEDF